MGWYIVRVQDLDGRDEGCAIFCSVTGSLSSITHDLCEACGGKLEDWVEQAERRAP